MSNPSVELYEKIRLDPIQSGENRRTVRVRIETNMEEYLRDPTGRQIRTSSYRFSRPRVFEISLRSTNLEQIYQILLEGGRLSHPLSQYLTSYIATTEMGLVGINSFVISLIVKLTYQRVCGFNIEFLSLRGIGEEEEEDVVERLVREGAIDLNLDSEKDECSICIAKLLGVLDDAPTRMPCSHVFHSRCISQWLHRKNSCPLCRRPLYGT